MKTNFKYVFLMAAALVVGFSSCSNDDADNKDAESQTLLIKLPSDVVLGTRVVDGSVTLPAKTAVTTIKAYMLNVADKVVKVADFLPDDILAGEKQIEDVPGSAVKVMLLANIPTGVVETVPGIGDSGANIKIWPFTTAGQNHATGDGVKYKTLIGESNIPTTTTSNPAGDGHDYKEVPTVYLAAVTSRMEIGTVTKGKGIASITLEGVWINSFYQNGAKVPTDIVYHNSNASYWVTNPPIANSPSTSTNFAGNVNVPIYSNPEYYNKADSRVVLNAPTTSMVYAYHVFSGSNVPHLIMLVSGEYTPEYTTAAGKYFFGWVTFTQFLEGGGGAITDMIANCIYRIGTDGSGITIDAEDITDYPESMFDLGVKVEITEWTEKTVTPSV